jgi:hypothetical protein
MVLHSFLREKVERRGRGRVDGSLDDEVEVGALRNMDWEVSDEELHQRISKGGS